MNIALICIADLNIIFAFNLECIPPLFPVKTGPIPKTYVFGLCFLTVFRCYETLAFVWRINPRYEELFWYIIQVLQFAWFVALKDWRNDII